MQSPCLSHTELSDVHQMALQSLRPPLFPLFLLLLPLTPLPPFLLILTPSQLISFLLNPANVNNSHSARQSRDAILAPILTPSPTPLPPNGFCGNVCPDVQELMSSEFVLCASVARPSPVPSSAQGRAEHESLRVELGAGCVRVCERVCV